MIIPYHEFPVFLGCLLVEEQAPSRRVRNQKRIVLLGRIPQALQTRQKVVDILLAVVRRVRVRVLAHGII